MLEELQSRIDPGGLMTIKPKGRILFAVTNDDNWELVRYELSIRGFVVRRARTVAEMAQAAARGRFDLYVLSNSSLEGGTGRDACQWIRSVDPNTPMLFYSGVAYTKDIKAALALGADDYIVLPDVDGTLPIGFRLWLNALEAAAWKRGQKKHELLKRH